MTSTRRNASHPPSETRCVGVQRPKHGKFTSKTLRRYHVRRPFLCVPVWMDARIGRRKSSSIGLQWMIGTSTTLASVIEFQSDSCKCLSCPLTRRRTPLTTRGAPHIEGWQCLLDLGPEGLAQGCSTYHSIVFDGFPEMVEKLSTSGKLLVSFAMQKM